MKRVIRSFLCALCFALFGIGALVLGGLIFPIILLVYRNPMRQRKILSYFVHISWRFFVWLMVVMRLISVKCSDKQRLRSLRGHIIIANHPSLIDIVILISRIPNSVCVVKKGLFHNFFIKHVIRKIYLSNDLPAEEFVNRGMEFLKAGYNIIIFPEGTRTMAGRKIKLHRGFAYLHLESKCPILPIHIENSTHILGKNQPWWDVGTKTSVYTLTLKKDIKYDVLKTSTIRNAAIKVTNIAETEIFHA